MGVISERSLLLLAGRIFSQVRKLSTTPQVYVTKFYNLQPIVGPRSYGCALLSSLIATMYKDRPEVTKPKFERRLGPLVLTLVRYAAQLR